MAKRQFAHLVKPVLIQEGPPGLYPFPRVFMEGKDLEGFNANFSYGFFTEPASFHPVEGAVVHPYDEVLVFAGIDTSDILKLGGECSIELGEERELYTITEPTVVVVPKGTPHGPAKVLRADLPIAHYHIGLEAEYRAEAVPVAAAPSQGEKYRHLVKRLVTTIHPAEEGSGMGYESVVDERGVMRPAERGVGPGNGDQIVWLFGPDLENISLNFTWGHYSRCGKWHRGGEIHTHPEEEILVFVGLNPADLTDLGCEIELGMGPSAERHVFSQATVAICPKGFPHLPVITRWCDKPYGFFVACLSGEHASPWVEVEEE